jgi:hypothetical protein
MRDGAMLVVLALLAASRATSGHAAVDGGFSLAEVSQFLHLASIAVWSGGVIASGLVVVPTLWRANKPEQVVAFTTRLSRVVTVALLVVAVTGAYNAYRGLGRSLVPLAHTVGRASYGEAGARFRCNLHRRIQPPNGTRSRQPRTDAGAASRPGVTVGSRGDAAHSHDLSILGEQRDTTLALGERIVGGHMRSSPLTRFRDNCQPSNWRWMP